MKEESTLYVHFSFGKKAKHWIYREMPKDWQNTGHLNKIMGESWWDRVEDFMGPEKSKIEMKVYLRSYFKLLVEEKAIEKFTIKEGK